MFCKIASLTVSINLTLLVIALCKEEAINIAFILGKSDFNLLLSLNNSSVLTPNFSANSWISLSVAVTKRVVNGVTTKLLLSTFEILSNNGKDWLTFLPFILPPFTSTYKGLPTHFLSKYSPFFISSKLSQFEALTVAFNIASSSALIK